MTARRALLSCAVVIAAAVALLPGGAGAQRRTVTIWSTYGGTEEQGLKEAIRAFERAHSDIQVRLLTIPFGAFKSKISSAIPTGRGPDVFIDAHDRITEYVMLGLIEPYARLDRYLAEEGGSLDFERAHVEAAAADGQLYGLPIGLKTPALYVNDELAGGDPDSLETIEGLRARLADDRFPLVFEADNGYYVAALLHAFGGRMIDDDGRFAMVGDAAVRTVERLRALIAGRVIPEEADGDLVKRLFGSGRAAFAISGPWLAPDLPDDLRWHVVPLPAASGSRMVPYVTVETVLLAKEPDDPEASRTLMEFLAGAEGARIRGRVGRQIVAAKSAWDDPELASDPLLSTFREAASRGVPMPKHPNMPMVFEPVQRALRKTLRGEAEAGAALVEAQHRHATVTRALPDARDPTLPLVALGVLLLGTSVVMVRRGFDPAMRGEIRRSLPAYRWVMHAFVAVGLLVIAPLVVGAATSLFAGRGTDMYYVGLANYWDILTVSGGGVFDHGSFYVVLGVTVLWTAANLALHLAIGMALALLLNRPALKLKGIYRVLLILPWAVPSYVTALAWKGMFHRQYGSINAILEALGAEPVSWFARWSTAFGANVATNVWLGFPFMMVVTLGALSTIPKELYEAAAVDGATAWQRFRLVTIPMLRPIVAPAVAMSAVWTFNMFNVIYLVSGGEPDGTTEILVSEAYRWAFTRSAQYGYAAAYAVLIFGILFLGTRWASRGVAKIGATA